MAAASRGPSSIPAPSIVPDSPFAAVNSSGVRARLGMRAPWVGRVTVSDVTAHAAAMMTSAGAAPIAIPIHVEPKAATWMR